MRYDERIRQLRNGKWVAEFRGRPFGIPLRWEGVSEHNWSWPVGHDSYAEYCYLETEAEAKTRANNYAAARYGA